MLNLSRLNRTFLYRQWRYFQLGYGLYLTKPISIINFLTISFYLLIERIEVLSFLLPHFYIYVIVTFFCLIPASNFLGWWHMRRSQIFAVEAILATESNPITVHSQRVGMENLLKLFRALNVEPSSEWLRLYEYWKALDRKTKWRP